MLIGRAAELNTLAGLLGEGRPVAVVGEAGAGKTTLLREAAAAAGRRVREGGGLATLAWSPYLPLVRALGSRVAGGDAIRVATEVERIVGDDLLIVDDLHWADPGTRQVLALLVERVSLATAVRTGDPAAAAALELAREHGFELVTLQPLRAADAVALVQHLRPDLDGPKLQRVLALAGGNPLLLEELSRSDEPTASLRMAVAARLGGLDPDARDAVNLLALAGRPLARSAMVTVADALVRDGFARRSGDEIEIRHALLAETVALALPDDERRALHLQLAAMTADDGVAARHYAAAGAREKAKTHAERAAQAAQTHGERAAHLLLAASLADDETGDELRLAACTALVDSHAPAAVEPLLAQIVATTPDIRATIGLLRVRARMVLDDLEGARRALQDATNAAAESGIGPEAAVLVATETSRVCALGDNDYATALEHAQRAVHLATDAGLHIGGALAVRGLARHYLQLPGWREDLERALVETRRAGDVEMEYRAANNLVLGLLSRGMTADALQVAQAAIRRADEAKLREWELRFEAWAVAATWHGGHPEAAARRGQALLDEVTVEFDRRVALPYVALALADLGRLDEARIRVREQDVLIARLDPADAGEERDFHAWSLAALEFAAGRYAEAEQAAAQAEGSSDEAVVLARLVGAWARAERGLNPGRPEVTSTERLTAGAPAEVEALAQWHAGDFAAAAEAFDRASGLYEGQVPSRMRCLWGRGEALRRADDATAVEALLAAEQMATERGYHVVLARIHRSLRLAGVHRAAARTQTGGGITGRERQVLELVGQGLTNPEIAARLGVNRHTVARLVATSSAKLGARNRAHAATLVPQG